MNHHSFILFPTQAERFAGPASWIPDGVCFNEDVAPGIVGRRYNDRQYAAGDTRTRMVNTLLPPDERNLTPDEVEQLDRRRRRGQLCLVICLQLTIVATLVTLWAGQDLTYSPGWMHPMVYWDALLFGGALFFGLTGLRLRRGSTEFISY
jgi:hypothetical protein